MKKSCFLFFILALFGAPTRAQQLQISAPKSTFPIGEPIPITMRTTVETDDEFSVRFIERDRSGRTRDYHFTATDQNDQPVRDPAPQLNNPLGLGGGGVTTQKLTREKPLEQRVLINQWLAFDAPGKYRITAHSRVVHRGAEPFKSEAIELTSAPLTLEITAPDESSRQLRLNLAQSVVAIPDRQIDQTNRETRLAVVQNLRFMLDERAIPILVRALSDGWINVQHEAKLGLLAFQDSAPVKRELRRVLESDTEFVAPDASRYFLNLLASDEKDAPMKNAQLWKAKQARQLALQPPLEAAKTLVAGLKSYEFERDSAQNWRRVLAMAPQLSPETQRDAAELLEHQIFVDPKQGKPISRATLEQLRASFALTARDEKVEGLLRASCIVALQQLGDASFGDFLAEQLMAPKPQLWRVNEWGKPWKNALKGMKGHRAREIALNLLAQFNAPDFFQSSDYRDFYARRSIIFRLSDFGAALSVDELKSVMQRLFAPKGDLSLRDPILLTLARKSPDDTVPFIQKLTEIKGEDANIESSNTISGVLTRLDGKVVRDLVQKLFHSPEAEHRSALVMGFARSASEAREKIPLSKGLPIRPDLSVAYFPEILRLFETDPAPEVRGTAFYALAKITGIPNTVYFDGKHADDRQYLEAWKQWGTQNLGQ